MEKKRTFAPGVLLLLIGLIVIIASVVMAFVMQSFRDKALEATATIVRIDQTGFDEEATYQVYVEFETEDGQTVYTDLGYSSGMEVGDHVTVFYNPKNPEKLMTGSNFLLVAAAAGMGLLLSWMGSAAYLKHRKQKQAA